MDRKVDEAIELIMGMAAVMEQHEAVEFLSDVIDRLDTAVETLSGDGS